MSVNNFRGKKRKAEGGKGAGGKKKKEETEEEKKLKVIFFWPTNQTLFGLFLGWRSHWSGVGICLLSAAYLN